MDQLSTFDAHMLQQALLLSLEGRITAPPNPWVGCILTRNNTIIGKGFSSPAGSPHAEVVALTQAHNNTTGATAYVTLEPCCHFGRTPPCTKALIKAGITRVVIGIPDPDKRVQGQGIAELRAAGIEVVIAPDPTPFTNALAPYVHHRTTGLPYCIAKAAISIDGRIAAADGSSQWITGEEARLSAHRLRAESQAILIGIGTALKDNPRLTVRQITPCPPHPPLRVVLDSTGRLTNSHHLLDTKTAPTLIATTARCPKETIHLWEKAGAEVLIVKETSGRIDLLSLLNSLGQKGILQVLIEGGASILGAFLQANQLQRLCVYMGPCLLGSSGTPLFQTDSIHSLREAPKLNFLEAIPLGNTLRLDYGVPNAPIL